MVFAALLLWNFGLGRRAVWLGVRRFARQSDGWVSRSKDLVAEAGAGYFIRYPC